MLGREQNAFAQNPIKKLTFMATWQPTNCSSKFYGFPIRSNVIRPSLTVLSHSAKKADVGKGIPASEVDLDKSDALDNFILGFWDSMWMRK